jgi:hypothetical protein
MLTPQSYLPGAAGGISPYPGFPPGGGNSFPTLSPSSYLPPVGTMEPPIMNYSGPSMMPQMSLPPMFPPTMLQPQMPYPNQGMIMGPPSPIYDPGLRTYSRRRPVRICRRRRRSRRCRPVIHIIDSSSCSSLSSYTTISSCSRHHHHSRSHSRRRAITPQQQPIILLPMPCQQPAPAVSTSVQPQIQQPQQIILPPIQVQQPGQFQQQQLALPSMPLQQQQLALPPISVQQQPITLPPMQLNSSNFCPSTNSSPMIIPSGQPMPIIQSSLSMPQIATIGQTQQIQNVPLQYVQAARQSSSPLQYISSEPYSTIAPQRVLVNSTNRKQSTKDKPIQKSTSIRTLPQNDLKFGRRPFDWYEGEKKNKIINENVRIGQRRSTIVS